MLIPGTYEYVTLLGKGDVAHVIKLRILKEGAYPGLSRWAQSNHKGQTKQGKRAAGEPESGEEI